jgi:type IX secretion system PorP/SprF family membrane protein
MGRILTLVFGLVLISGLIKAQQSPLYSQFMLNKFLVNPACAGVEGMTTFNITSKAQWLEVKGAPITNSVSFQTRLSGKSFINRKPYLLNKYSLTNRKGNIGIGLNLYNDTRGLLSQTGFGLTYSVHFLINNIHFSFGVTSSFTQFGINKSKLTLDDYDDCLVMCSKLNKISPDFNFGAYLLAEEWYAGISANNLLQSTINFSNFYCDKFKYLRQYNIIGGYRFGVSSDFAIEPSFMLKSTEKLNNQLDLAARFYYNNLYWCGVGYRTGGTISFNFGVKYNRFYFGYAYDYSFNGLQSASIGSHEIMITYKIGKRTYRKKWLERF